MQKVTAITADPNQTLGIILPDGSTVNLTLNYIPAQQGWCYSVSYGSFQANLMRIVVSPNMLRRFRNIIPFGLAVTTTDGYEVVNQNDFISGRAAMYALDASDVAQVETLITTTIPNQLGNFVS